MPQTVDQLLNIGPFFSGNTGPPLDFILTWDSGGYVNLEDAYVEAVVRRWDPRRKVPIGPEISRGPCEITSPGTGEVTFRWIFGSPIDTVPVDPGWYYVQVNVTDSAGNYQNSQRAIFEVLPS